MGEDCSLKYTKDEYYNAFYTGINNLDYEPRYPPLTEGQKLKVRGYWYNFMHPTLKEKRKRGGWKRTYLSLRADYKSEERYIPDMVIRGKKYRTCFFAELRARGLCYWCKEMKENNDFVLCNKCRAKSRRYRKKVNNERSG